MALNIGDNFKYQGKKPNFERDSFATKAEMKGFPEANVDEGHISFCEEDGKHYEFKAGNSVDTNTGKWREFTTNVDLSGYATKTEVQQSVANKVDKSYVDGKVDVKQDKLADGINIKTINGQPIMGKGNITIAGPDGQLDLSGYATKTEMLNNITDYNVSKHHPTEGIGGTNKFTLESAIKLIPESLRSVGIKCSFLDNADNISKCYVYQGDTFYELSSWRAVVTNEDIYMIEADFSKNGFVASNGFFSEDSSFQRTDYINIKGFTNIYGYLNIGNSGFAIAFFDKDKKIMMDSSVLGDGKKIYTITIPNNAVYVVISNYVISEKYCNIYKSNSLSARFSELSNRIDDYNISKLDPVGSNNKTDKYDFADAILKIPKTERKIGVRCIYLNNSGDLKNYTYIGGPYEDINSWRSNDDNYPTITADFKINGYIDSHGLISSNVSSQRTDYINIKGYTNIDVTANLNSEGCIAAFFDIDKKFLPTLKVVGDGHIKSYKIKVPEQAVFVILSNYGSNNKEAVIYKDNITEKRLAVLEKQLTTDIDNKIIKYGVWAKDIENASAYKATYKLEEDFVAVLPSAQWGYISAVFTPVQNHIYYLYAAVKEAQGINLALGDSDVLQSVDTSADFVLASGRRLIRDNSSQKIVLSCILASGFKPFYIKSWGVIDLTDNFGAGNEPTENEMDEYIRNNNMNLFSNLPSYVFSRNAYNFRDVTEHFGFRQIRHKKVIVFGDSITCTNRITPEGALEKYKTNWTSYALDALDAEYYNYAQDGAGWLDNPELTQYQKVSEQIKLALSHHAKTDIIIISLGTNNWTANNDTLQQAVDIQDIELLDKTKIHQAIKWALWSLRMKYPKARIFIFLPLQRADCSSKGAVFTPILSMSELYGCCIFDQFREVGICSCNEKKSAEGLYLSDGLHPNEEGKKLQARYVVKKLLEYYIEP